MKIVSFMLFVLSLTCALVSGKAHGGLGGSVCAGQLCGCFNDPYKAIAENDLLQVQQLLERGVSFDNPSGEYVEKGITPFMLAVASPSSKEIQLAILGAHGIDVNRKTASGVPTLSLAIAGKVSLVVVEELLSRGADVNQSDSKGRTPILHAVGLDASLETVRLLSKYEANMVHIDDSGQNIFHYTALGGVSTEIFDELFREVPHLLQSPDTHGDLPVYFAATSPNYELYFKFLEHVGWMTPLQRNELFAISVIYGNDGGYLAATFDAVGGSASHVYRGSFLFAHAMFALDAPLEKTELLLSIEPEVLSMKSVNGRSFLEEAVISEASLDIVKLLVMRDKENRVFSGDDFNKSLMHACVFATSFEMVNLLLDNGGSLNGYIVRDGTTPFLAACQSQASPDVIRRLMDRDVDLSLKTVRGESASQLIESNLFLKSEDKQSLLEHVKWSGLKPNGKISD